MTGTVCMTAIAYLPDACVCPSPRLCQSGGRLVELTNRCQKSISVSPTLLLSVSPRVCLASDQPGFLNEILDEAPQIKQLITPLASREFLSKLDYCECTVIGRRTDGGHRANTTDPSSNEFKRALQDLAISMSSAFGPTHVVFAKWRAVNNHPDFTSTIYNIGFSPPELKETFVKRALAKMALVNGLSLLDHELQVSDIVTEQGFKFFANIPPGYTDETLLAAMVEQGGLDHDHILSFGIDHDRKAKCLSPSGDMFFYFAPAGCRDHGSTMIDDTSPTGDPLISILQPPSSFFVKLPNGNEHHIRIRKAQACQSCWATPGRHPYCIYKGICKMCLVHTAEMDGKGKRHACGQGDMFREKVRAVFDPNMEDVLSKPASSRSAAMKQRMQDNIAGARMKRGYEEMATDELSAEQRAEQDAELAALGEPTEKPCKASKSKPGASPSQ